MQRLTPVQGLLHQSGAFGPGQQQHLQNLRIRDVDRNEHRLQRYPGSHLEEDLHRVHPLVLDGVVDRISATLRSTAVVDAGSGRQERSDRFFGVRVLDGAEVRQMKGRAAILLVPQIGIGALET